MAEQRFSVKRYATGKFIVYATGPEEHAAAIAYALKFSASLSVSLDESRFADRLRELGVPDDQIATIVASWDVVDETYSRDD